VGNFASGNVYVFDATTRSLLSVIWVGPNPTFVKIHPITNRIFVPTYGNNGLAIINGYTDTVERVVGGAGAGTWGVAVNPTLNRVYLGSRDTGAVATLDGNDGYRVIEGQTITPCGDRGSPYGMEFNPINNKLYIACAPAGNVDHAAVYQATAGGLTRLAYVTIGNGGRDGGGGVTVDTSTGNAFFTNSVANTVSVIGGVSNSVVATLPVGLNPFGAAADPVTKRVFVGNRGSHNLHVILDTYGP
jgi:YVTN family beta-propeller protein